MRLKNINTRLRKILVSLTYPKTRASYEGNGEVYKNKPNQISGHPG